MCIRGERSKTAKGGGLFGESYELAVDEVDDARLHRHGRNYSFLLIAACNHDDIERFCVGPVSCEVTWHFALVTPA